MEREVVGLALSRGSDSKRWKENFNESHVRVLGGNMQSNRSVSILKKDSGVNPEVQDGSGCGMIRGCTSAE